MIDLRPRHMVFAAASAVSLMTAACGGTTIDDAAEEDTGGPTGIADPDAEIPEDLAIDFLPKQLNNPFFDLVNDGGQEAVEELGGQATERGGTEATADSQVEYINAAGQAGSDVIVIAANDPDAVCPALDEARDNGAAIVGYENPAFFRRLFKRCTGLTPGAYRRMFKPFSEAIATPVELKRQAQPQPAA